MLLAASSGNVLAQSQSPSSPPVELSLNWVVLGGLIDVSAEGNLQLGVTGPGLGVRMNVWERVGLEVRGMLGTVEGRSVGFYDATVVFRRSTPQPGRWSSFFRLGAGGHYESVSVPEFRRTNQDRSVSVFPGYEWRKLTGPNLALGGMGVQRTFSPRAAVAIEGDLVGGALGLGLRVSTGLVVPLGSYGAR
jgi:hypothetical protein